jgi:hypothetical protein
MKVRYFVTYDLVQSDLDKRSVEVRREAVELLLREQLEGRQTLSNQWCVQSDSTAEALAALVKADLESTTDW